MLNECCYLEFNIQQRVNNITFITELLAGLKFYQQSVLIDLVSVIKRPVGYLYRLLKIAFDSISLVYKSVARVISARPGQSLRRALALTLLTNRNKSVIVQWIFRINNTRANCLPVNHSTHVVQSLRSNRASC